MSSTRDASWGAKAAGAAALATGTALFGTAFVVGLTAPKDPEPEQKQNRQAVSWGLATVLAGAASAAAAARMAAPEQRVVAGFGAGVTASLGTFLLAHGSGGQVSPWWWLLPIGGAAVGSATATEIHRAVT